MERRFGILRGPLNMMANPLPVLKRFTFLMCTKRFYKKFIKDRMIIPELCNANFGDKDIHQSQPSEMYCYKNNTLFSLNLERLVQEKLAQWEEN